MITYFSKLFITMGIASMAFGNPVSANEIEPMSKRVIVQVKGTETGDFNGEVISSKQDRKQTTLTLEVPEGTSMSAFIKELKQEENVLRVEEDHLLTSTYTPNDFFYPYQSHHNNIHSSEAWERSRGANVTVAILDTGIDLYHEDLKNKIVNPYDVVYDSPYTLSAGEHGTHVAGIVGSQMDNYYGGTGVAPDASIMPIDVFAGTSAYTSDVIEGVYRAVDQGADIINMSLGNYYYSYSFQQAINYAYANDVLVVAAAGNDSTSATHYPSSYNYVISVGSTTSYDTLSYFSNYGWDIDVTAPGSSIYSTTPYSSYGYMSGTSMASPVVAGVAAMLKSNEPGLSVDAITERLTSTADDLGSTGWDYYYGSGRVNAKEALQIRELEAVTLDEFSDASDTITGTVPSGNGYGSVVIYDGWGNEVGTADYLSGGDTFTIPTSRYPAGTMMRAMYYDYIGNHSPFAWFTVTDRTAPAKPSVNAVSDAADTVTGKAEADSQVSVKAGTTLLGQATAKADGTYIVTIAKQKAGTRLSVTSTDAAGNISPIVETTVIDKTAPIKPIVDLVSDLSIAVTGKAEPTSTISVHIGTTLLGQAVTKEDGTYVVVIEKQPVGTVLRITSKDAAGNVSPAIETTVVDKTAPAKPSVNVVTDAADTVTGKAEVGSTVTVKAGTVLLGQVTTKADGTYAVTVGKQKAGTRLSVTSTDAAGNVSPVVETTVIDKTAPITPTVSEVTDQTIELNGTAEAGTTIMVKVGSIEIAKGTVGTDGTFRLAIPKQAVATRLSITSTDAAGNISSAVVATVLDRTAPAIPRVDEVSDQTTVISGTAEAQAVVHIKNDAVEIGKAFVQADGTFRVSIAKQPANTVLQVIVIDGAGNVSQSVSVLVADKSAPVLQINQITNQTVTIQGTTEVRAVVEMTYAQKVTRVTADANGRFSFTIKAPKTGERFSFVATDAAGNKGDALNLTVTDLTKPLLSGVSAFTLEAGRSFDPRQGVAAIDETDGDVTSSMLISGLVDVKKPGVYPVTYIVKDRAGNEGKAVRQITVKDTVKPTLSGVKTKTVNWNTSFDARKGITAKDNISGDLTKAIKVSGKVDVKKVGTYAVTYSVTDQSGNTTTAVRKVVVKDHIKPVISGAKSKTIKLKSSFKPLTGVSAKDNVDGTLTKSIKVTGKVDTKRKGVYPLTYTVKDKAGNITVVKVKITVK